MASYNKGIIHPRCKVYAGCWETDVGSLAGQGWKFEIFSSPSYRIEIAAKNPNTGLVGKFFIDENKIQLYRYGEIPVIYFSELAILKGEVYKEMHLPQSYDFMDLDVGINTMQSNDNFFIYSPREEEAQEIIVTPESIPMLLEEIRKAQEPQAREILHKQRKRELQDMQVKAKILSFG